MLFTLIATGILLTFDDGISKNTKQVWDMLAEHNIQARFYVVWSTLESEENRKIAKRLSEQWHSICNHTYSHKNLTTMHINEVIRELTRTSDLIEKATGKKPNCFRPPFWAVNIRIRILSRILWMRVHWSLSAWIFDTMDWDKTVDPVERMKNHITTSHTEILMHDNQDVVIKEVEYILKHIFRK